MPSLITDRTSTYADVLFRLTPGAIEYPHEAYYEFAGAAMEDMIKNDTPAPVVLSQLQQQLEEALRQDQ
ncbi:hypothetical protein D3C77_799490 [compost metagenome]